jgi:hypothetical protein
MSITPSIKTLFCMALSWGVKIPVVIAVVCRLIALSDICSSPVKDNLSVLNVGETPCQSQEEVEI